MEAFENVLDGVGMVDSVVDDGNDRVCYLLWGQAVIRCQSYYMAYMEMLR